MDIYEILNLKKDEFSDFHLLSNQLNNYQIERTIRSNITKLNAIEERYISDITNVISKESVDDILFRIKNQCTNKIDSRTTSWSLRDLRILSYSLFPLTTDYICFNYALGMLDIYWNMSILNGLIYHIIRYWYSPNSQLHSIWQLVEKHLKNYDGGNQRYLKIKNHLDYLDPNNGVLRMSALLKHVDIPLNMSPTILGLNKSYFKYPYFSDVILRFIQNNDIIDLDLIQKILKHHDFIRTKKLLFAYLVERANSLTDSTYRKQLRNLIKEQLGDVDLHSTWAPFKGATLEEKLSLKHAMHIIETWSTFEVIELFFDKCIQDKNRMFFWLSYVECIDNYLFVGSLAVKRLLSTDKNLSSLINKNFIETNSQTGQTCALILFINKTMFVEFSDVGSLYIYPNGHSMQELIISHPYNVKSINQLKITSLDLINTSMPKLDVGRFSHQQNWQRRLSEWLYLSLFSRYKKYTNVISSIPYENLNSTIINQAKDGLFMENVHWRARCHVTRKVEMVMNDQAIYFYDNKKNYYYLLYVKNEEDIFFSDLFMCNSNDPWWFSIVEISYSQDIRKKIGFIRYGINGLHFKEKLEDKNELIFTFE